MIKANTYGDWMCNTLVLETINICAIILQITYTKRQKQKTDKNKFRINNKLNTKCFKKLKNH